MEIKKYNGNNPFGLNINPIIIGNSKDVFSFSLFIPNDIFDNHFVGGTYSDKFREWLRKYFNLQLQRFELLLFDNNWSYFGIVHFIEDRILNIVLRPSLNDVLISSNPHFKKNIEKKITIRDYIIKRTNNFLFHNRYTLISYSCPIENDNCKSEYFGSIVRFIAMRINSFNSVMFRDAHSTMPSRRNTYDIEWYNTWINSDKKFLIYNMINYNPEHSHRNHTMFAAAWSSRKSVNDTVIMEDNIWSKFENGLLHVKNSKYGIDEQLLIYFTNMNDDYFIKNSYIIGITHIIWLFLPKLNLLQFKKWKYTDKNGNIKSNYPFQQITPDIILDTKGELISNITSKDMISFKDGGQGIIAQPYFSEITCILKNIFDDNLNSSMEEIFQFIETRKNNDLLFRSLCDQIPARSHLWSYLFDNDENIHITPNQFYQDLNTNLLNMVYTDVYGNRVSIDILNQCKITKKFFTGGKFDYDGYQYLHWNNNGLLVPHYELPHDIQLPQGYSDGRIIN